MPPTCRWLVIGSPLILVSCTDYNMAVGCAAAFEIAAEQVNQETPGEDELVRLQKLAHADAERHARSAGKSMTQSELDIQSSEMTQRAQLTGGAATVFDSQTFKDCWTQYQ